jgi:DNA-binding NtrC family response regulator
MTDAQATAGESVLRILVVDDDRSTCHLLHSILVGEGYECHTARNIQEAEQSLSDFSPELALVDIYLGETSGVQFLDRLKQIASQCKCVMMTAHASLETVAQSTQGGALEYLRKPLLINELLELVQKIDECRTTTERQVTDTEEVVDSVIVGRGPKMVEVYRAIARVAKSDASVIISGPSGTGKELVARAIHAHSPRVQMRFTAVNCGALSETILESELFGYEKGAFTGADRSRVGLFEEANGGTLFLDEISETSQAFQVKLLRAVQEREVRRLGGSRAIAIDVRILAATNRDIGSLVKSGQFRADLYYRLGVVTIKVPSLEERKEDIPLLIKHFLQRSNERCQRQVTFLDDSIQLMTSLAWSGNVRELENLIERLVLFSGTGMITPSDVEQHKQAITTETSTPVTLRATEREQILRVLHDSSGNKSLAARRLGIERKTLYEKAKRLGISFNE